jgi:hypothetical protein
MALATKDADGAALAFARPHKVRAQLLGGTYQSDSMYKQGVEGTVHNGSSYGELGSDAAKKAKATNPQLASTRRSGSRGGSRSGELVGSFYGEGEQDPRADSHRAHCERNTELIRANTS